MDTLIELLKSLFELGLNHQKELGAVGIGAAVCIGAALIAIGPATYIAYIIELARGQSDGGAWKIEDSKDDKSKP